MDKEEQQSQFETNNNNSRYVQQILLVAIYNQYMLYNSAVLMHVTLSQNGYMFYFSGLHRVKPGLHIF